MVIPLWLAACATSPDLTNVIRGIQVVAIEASPAEPRAEEPLTLTAWVADGIGRGSDVLVWVCTPVDGHCLESGLVADTALPFSLWSRVGEAEVAFASVSSWPQYVALAGEVVPLPDGLGGGNLLVWALACAPGVCPIIDRVAIDPEPGSDAWRETERMLADPASWIDTVPRGQASLALKSVGVWYPEGAGGRPDEPNRAPILEPVAIHEDRVTKFRVGDPDGDLLSIRSFTTAGGVVQTRTGDTGLGVLWEEPLRPGREAVRFVVAEDGRGGTTVWCSEAPTCDGPPITFTSAYRPLVAGDPLPVGDPWYPEFYIEAELLSPTSAQELNARVLVDGRTIAESSSFVDSGISSCIPYRAAFFVSPVVVGAPDEICAMLGRIATVELERVPLDGGPPASAAIQLVLTGNAGVACAP